jgi:hypothetical protein
MPAPSAWTPATKGLLQRRQGQLVEPPLIQEHEIIRPLADYARIISPDREDNS